VAGEIGRRGRSGLGVEAAEGGGGGRAGLARVELEAKTGRAITDEGDDAAVDDSDRVGAGPEVFADQGGRGFVAFGDPAAWLSNTEWMLTAVGKRAYGSQPSQVCSALTSFHRRDVRARLTPAGRASAVALPQASQAARVADSKVDHAEAVRGDGIGVEVSVASKCLAAVRLLIAASAQVTHPYPLPRRGRGGTRTGVVLTGSPRWSGSARGRISRCRCRPRRAPSPRSRGPWWPTIPS
jgi:hypothetical protein